jgi:hypothetical protein
MIPPQYFHQIIEHGRGMYDECGVWKSIFVNGNGTVMVPCWKFDSPENIYNLLEQSVEEIWNAPEWDIAKTCHARNYMNGLSRMIGNQKPELKAELI